MTGKMISTILPMGKSDYPDPNATIESNPSFQRMPNDLGEASLGGFKPVVGLIAGCNIAALRYLRCEAKRNIPLEWIKRWRDWIGFVREGAIRALESLVVVLEEERNYRSDLELIDHLSQSLSIPREDSQERVEFLRWRIELETGAARRMGVVAEHLGGTSLLQQLRNLSVLKTEKPPQGGGNCSFIRVGQNGRGAAGPKEIAHNRSA